MSDWKWEKENDLNEFKEGFAERYGWASDRFADAIKQIDKSIKALQDTKDNLIKSEDHLRIANNKAQEVTVKRLTKNNDTMKSRFEKLKEEWFVIWKIPTAPVLMNGSAKGSECTGGLNTHCTPL